MRSRWVWLRCRAAGEKGLEDGPGPALAVESRCIGRRQERILDSQYENRSYSCTSIFRIGIVPEK